MYRLGEFNSDLLKRFAQRRRLEILNPNNPRSSATGTGTFYYGNFTLEKAKNDSVIHDTFVRLDGWTKVNLVIRILIKWIRIFDLLNLQGQIWVNGFNLGRYWPGVGPQETLYLPGPLLNTAPETNQVIVFELESAPEDCRPTEFNKEAENSCFIRLTDTHVINGETPYKQSPFSIYETSLNSV